MKLHNNSKGALHDCFTASYTDMIAMISKYVHGHNTVCVFPSLKLPLFHKRVATDYNAHSESLSMQLWPDMKSQ